MIDLRPYSDEACHAVMCDLDPWDWLEVEATRGERVTALGLFADWRALQAARLESWAVHSPAGRPFALVALVAGGQRGVAGAAMVARPHDRWRRPLAEVALAIRARMPEFAASRGIHRIEARAWSRHPTAARFLSATGFRLETRLPGFGADGCETFLQFAWTTAGVPTPAPDPTPAPVPAPNP